MAQPAEAGEAGPVATPRDRDEAPAREIALLQHHDGRGEGQQDDREGGGLGIFWRIVAEADPEFAL